MMAEQWIRATRRNGRERDRERERERGMEE